jgi:Mrp family chromosome partitioning ATPase
LRSPETTSRSPAEPSPAPPAAAEPPPPAGRGDAPHARLAVWGPKGAPGRTTVAVNLAFEAARLVGEVLLVDADTYGRAPTSENLVGR